MSKTVTLGGDRLGSGKKQKVTMHGFERSTHDLGEVFRTTMSVGTLVPFLNKIALPGDTIDINLGADVKTLPTVGPLFGSFKLQLDVFQCPMRLYIGWLHNNKLNIGMDMASVRLPYMEFKVNPHDFTDQEIPLEFQQFNQSSLLAYLGIRGIASPVTYEEFQYATANKQVLSLISYWDVYKNYYANKQEERGFFIHTEAVDEQNEAVQLIVYDPTPATIYTGTAFNTNIPDAGFNGTTGIGKIRFGVPAKTVPPTNATYFLTIVQLSASNAGEPEAAINTETITGLATYTDTANGLDWYEHDTDATFDDSNWYVANLWGSTDIAATPTSLIDAANTIKVTEFDLENIDSLREAILQQGNGIKLNDNNWVPFGDVIKTAKISGAYGHVCSYFSQEGLGIKTYQSDIFNNWLNTEWVEGDNGINAITAIDTSDGSFTIDTLNLSKKVYDMLNRIAVSGGTYEDWLEAVYDHQGYRKAETPMYMGGLSKEIIFQEVVSTAETGGGDNPLGTLAGKGTLASKHKGGSMTIHVDEPSIILGIVSITPRIDYYQGNDWATNLITMDDLHKPNLDEIGFQDLLTDQMAFWDTRSNEEGIQTVKAAGKQPAWLNYMTSFNKIYGNFADERNQMFMTLARRYTASKTGEIENLTTYIDPSQYNYAFAQTDLTAQNFMVQIAADITARRKMSARLIPNL